MLGTQPLACAVSLMIVLHIKMSLVTTDKALFATFYKKRFLKNPNEPKRVLLSKRNVIENSYSQLQMIAGNFFKVCSAQLCV